MNLRSESASVDIPHKKQHLIEDSDDEESQERESGSCSENEEGSRNEDSEEEDSASESIMTEECLSDLAVIAMHYSERIAVDKICHNFVHAHPQRLFQASLFN